ncbi:DUF5810 domain-containing protein [Halolamina sp.]|jgi:hypothetical protein|uniref:DUF5810 domain-containing protein n=1 Tax=Halolamina sp. TaxID=1940283 RepID=UPI000223B7EB|nr:hypothetical protein Halar_1906 [halophilic archaeon DL31]
MGYSCPVCETPQHDSEHLANHLAMTAMLHEADHEAWLDEHVEGWAELTPPDLGTRVVDAAEEVDYDEAAVEAADIPEERQGEPDEHDHEHDHDHQPATEEAPVPSEEPTVQSVTDDLDLETEQILQEARELTQQRREATADEDEE